MDYKKKSENRHGRQVSNKIQFLSSLANYALGVFKARVAPKHPARSERSLLSELLT